MNRTHSRTWLFVGCMCLIFCLSGCRNRVPYCPPGCYPNGSTGGPFNNVIGSTTVPAPATYSINIPGQNRPYYNANATAQVPTPSTGTLPGNGTGAWRPAGSSANQGGTLPSTSQPNQTSPVSGSNTRNQPANTGGNRLTSVVDRPNTNRVANNAPVGGLSFTNDNNFRTTAVDERRDQTRLPVTDASLVRAPTTFTPATTVGQFNNAYYNQTAYNQVPAVNPARIAQNPPTLQSGSAFNSQPTTAPNVVVGSFGQPTFAQPPRQTYQGLTTQNPQVLAQSTVYADPTDNPNFDNGWRDRDLTASRNPLNR